ncbi:MAG TPA: EAL domain-containing protein [Planctomycetota bacterium]|nr:EAL domain-containing protein [Planctomycetota bacterium]
MSTDPVAQLPLPAGSGIERYCSSFRRAEGLTETVYRGFRVRSAFQPIFSFAHSRAVGYEGLARAWDERGEVVPPPVLLAAERSSEGIIFLDRLLRALHLANFSGPAFQDTWLFLNVAPEVVIRGRSFGPFFREALQAYGISPKRVVLEVTEGATEDEATLESATRYYRDIGCLVAIDDFGAGHSNFDRIWHLRPDIVKLDRSMISRAARDHAARRGLVGIAGLLHEAGALVLAEGVETEEEAVVSLQAEVDLLQGYLLAKPCVGAMPSVNTARFSDLREALRHAARDEEAEFGAALRPYLEAFARAAELLDRGEAYRSSVVGVLPLRQVMRCYLLDSSGTQQEDNVDAPGYVRRREFRHLPLGSAIGANWMHRHYFRRAIANPNKTQVSRPYLSLTDPQMCVTLSRLVGGGDQARVLCCDLEFPVAPPSSTRELPS